MKEQLKKFWEFLKKDTWQSWLVSLILIVVFIKLIFFPTLSLLTNSPLPLVVVESCSMYHETDFDSWWQSNKEWYESRGITEEQFKEFAFKSGLNKGDIIFVYNRGEVEIGDIIIFDSGLGESIHPIIHRVISLNPTATKGDHNRQQLTGNTESRFIDETKIPQEKIIGRSVGKIPIIGWVKLIFFEPFRAEQERGFCH